MLGMMKIEAIFFLNARFEEGVSSLMGLNFFQSGLLTL